jgi:hypothetical protein
MLGRVPQILVAVADRVLLLPLMEAELVRADNLGGD